MTGAMPASVPFGPLDAALNAEGLDQLPGVRQAADPQAAHRAVEVAVCDYRELGWLAPSTADRLCCEVLQVHPYEVYGEDWFSFDPVTIPVDADVLEHVLRQTEGPLCRADLIAAYRAAGGSTPTPRRVLRQLEGWFPPDLRARLTMPEEKAA